MNASRGEIIDIVGQHSPRSGLFGIDNMNASRVRLLITMVNGPLGLIEVIIMV